MSQRQRKARGSIEHRAGTWFLRVHADRIDATTGASRRQRIRISLGEDTALRSQVAARRAADAWLARNRPWEAQVGDSLLFGEFAEQYLRLVVPRFRKSSQRRYRSTIRAHLLPKLGSVAMNQLTESCIQALLLELAESGRRRTTISGIRAVLLQMMNRARAEGLDVATINPRLIQAPRDNRPPRVPVHLTAEQLQRILDASKDPLRTLWAVLGYAGLRCGEALALTWAHIDLDAGALKIRQNVSLGTIAPTKTLLSAQDVPIAPPLAIVLRHYRDTWKPNAAGLLWANRAGKPVNADHLRARRWHPLLKRLGLPACGFHALRHGTASRLFELGCNALVVQRVMRHQSLQQTQRYSHASFQQLQAAMNNAHRNPHS